MASQQTTKMATEAHDPTMNGFIDDKTFRRPIEWVSSARTDVGAVRKANEDAILMRPEVGLWAVADGMGGHEVGDVASRLIVEALEGVGPQKRLSDLVDAVEQSVVDANQNIIEYAKLMFENATMGSTLVSLVIHGRVGVALWAGDSRLYRLRNHQLSQLTRDHSHVQELLDSGAISEKEAKNHPHGNVITRAIGVEVDGFVDVVVFNTQIGDTFMLCSDGLYNTVNDQDIARWLANPSAENAVHQLVDASLNAGAPDNVSVIVVKGEAGKFEGYENTHE